MQEVSSGDVSGLETQGDEVSTWKAYRHEKPSPSFAGSLFKNGNAEEKWSEDHAQEEEEEARENKCLVIKAGEESRNQESIKLWETRNEVEVNTNAA